ncbi:unnamed protein product [Pelagomonas calceolata]|uniref:Anoctamin transmembrane domain-containing protein n=1 Tax=Pelagomonas calceolata TaxID=35677 RepID=A0A7S4A2Z8_9STRA|nr:unnamed protein product [Pelagomonas calceolata]
MSKVAPAGDMLDEAERLTAAPSVHYDYAIVVPKVSPAYLKELKERVEHAGFVTEEFDALSGQYEVSVLKLGAPQQRLMEFAFAQGVPGRLDPAKLQAAAAALDPPLAFNERPADEHGWSLGSLTEKLALFPLFDYIYAVVRPAKIDMFTAFVDTTRHKVILRMLCASSKLPGAARGAGLDARAMDRVEPAPLLPYKADKSGDGPRISTLILLHDHDKRDALHKEWLGNYKIILKPWEQPINHIRVYLGEQMGFYFLFVSTWATSYLINGIIGLVLYALMKLVPPFNGHGAIHQVPNALHAGLVIIMCSITLQKFKRQQEVCNKRWGANQWADAKPRVRPAFEGLPMTSVVHGKVELDFPDWWRRGRQTVAWSIIVVLLWADLGVVAYVNVLKHQKDEQIKGLANNHLSILIAMCQVQGVNALGSILARILTKYENWKTDEEYAHHLTMKDVIFQLINTFLPQFWVAFIEPMRYDDDKMCPPTNNCKGELSFQIAILFAGQAGYSLAKQAVLPVVLRFLSQRRIQRLGCEDNLGGTEGEPDADWRTEARKDFVELTEYDNIEGPIEDYVELTLQFGYVTMFTAVYPFAPLISFAFNTLQIWMDGHKLLKLHRRPLPLEVRNIGIWEDIFQILSKIGCVTNVALCFFVVDISPIFLNPRYEEDGRRDYQAVKMKLGLFIAFSVGFLLLTTVIEQLFTPVSTAVRVQRARQTIYQQCVLGDRETSAFVNEADAAPDDNSDLASGGHDDSFDIMAALRGG